MSKQQRWFITTVDLAEYQGQGVELLRQTRPDEVFIDRHGRPVTVSAEEMAEVVTNFEAGTAGQDIPIDIDHERGKSAGWIKRVWTEIRDFIFPDPEKPGKTITAKLMVLKALPEWNKLGVELVGEKIYKYFSVSVDLAGKVLKSASLVNFPSVKGLQPAELAEGASFAYIEDGFPMMVSMRAYLSARIHHYFTGIADNWAAAGLVDTEERIALSGAIGAALTAFSAEIGEVGDRMIRAPEPDLWFKSDQEDPNGGSSPTEEVVTMGDNQVVSLEEAVSAERKKWETEAANRETEFKERLAKEREEWEASLKEKQEVTALAEKLCGGDAGLSAKPDEVATVLLGLDPEARAGVVALLEAKVVQFGEVGSSREGRGGLKALPKPYTGLLRRWLEDKNQLAEFFVVNKEELGEMSQYDLAEFRKDDK